MSSKLSSNPTTNNTDMNYKQGESPLPVCKFRMINFIYQELPQSNLENNVFQLKSS
jgi:hypothetical protein